MTGTNSGPGWLNDEGCVMKTSLPKFGRAVWAAVGVGCVVGAAVLSGALAGSAPDASGSTVSVPLPGGVAAIDTATLEVYFTSADARRAWSAASPTRLGVPSTPTTHDGVTSWRYDAADLEVSVSAVSGRLLIEFTSGSDGDIVWPVAGVDETAASIEFPNGEGQSIPVDDAFWQSDESHLTESTWNLTDNLTMPFWGVTFRDDGVSYIVEADTDIGTELKFDAPQQRMQVSARHAFRSTLDTMTYRVTVSPTDGDPLASARDFRRALDDAGGITTLDEKIAADPNVEGLRGALHGYLWADGDNPALIARMRELGIDRAWLGYDIDVAPMSASTVAAATAAGYLVGPYDTWENAQDPLEADSSTSIWPGQIWPDGCALDENGEPLEGFGGRGCTLSSTAMAAEEEHSGVLSSRVETMTNNGVSSYFLDVDATGDLAHDHSPVHPQTKAQDRQNRIDRMGRLARGDYSDGSPLVLGSEKAEWWANPVLSFSHGSSTPISNGIWMLQKDKEEWGGFWPQERPAFFFRPVTLPDALAREMFAPRYRVPLYQAVLHDAVASADRWEMGLFKFAGLEEQRTLTNMLYNSPAMVSLDMRVLDERGEYLASMQEFFSFLQSAAATDALLSFERLGTDVQPTRFGFEGEISLTVTVNFGHEDSEGVAGGCALAETPGGTQTYCP